MTGLRRSWRKWWRRLWANPPIIVKITRTTTRPYCDECWHDRHIVFRLPNPDCEACRG